jgi:cytochrome b561
MHIIHITWEYLRERQPPAVRFLHIIILCLVLSQIIVSNFMGFNDNGEVSKKTVEYYGTWIHIGTGLTLLPLTFVFKKDLQQLKKIELPEPNDYGIAVIVQGLGLGALILVVLSGFTWFLSWIYMAPWADSIKELHQLLTGLIEAYVVGHGGMGVLHLFFKVKNPKNR